MALATVVVGVLVAFVRLRADGWAERPRSQPTCGPAAGDRRRRGRRGGCAHRHRPGFEVRRVPAARVRGDQLLARTALAPERLRDGPVPVLVHRAPRLGVQPGGWRRGRQLRALLERPSGRADRRQERPLALPRDACGAGTRRARASARVSRKRARSALPAAPRARRRRPGVALALVAAGALSAAVGLDVPASGRVCAGCAGDRRARLWGSGGERGRSGPARGRSAGLDSWRSPGSRLAAASWSCSPNRRSRPAAPPTGAEICRRR